MADGSTSPGLERSTTIRGQTSSRRAVWGGGRYDALWPAGCGASGYLPGPARSGHLEDDPLDHVGDVLASVGDDLHRLVNLLPLDHLDGIHRRIEQGGQALPEQPVGA